MKGCLFLKPIEKIILEIKNLDFRYPVVQFHNIYPL